MTNSGLTSRLRQQSRRTGFAVGFAMALTIAVCVGSFVIIYAQVDPFTRDFIAAPATATPTPNLEATKPAAKPASGKSAAKTTPTAEPAEEPAQSAETPPTPTPETFAADYHSNESDAVNFRSGPTTNSDVLQLLEAGTPMQSTGARETDDGGTVWMEFKLATGVTGWIREIDAIPGA